VIEARGLRKAFGRVVAVRDVSFVAPDGCVTGLLGPNGAGKTTTLRMLCTVLRPDAGNAVVDGVDATGDPLAVQRRIGALPESHGLYARLTARENIRYYGRLHGLRGDALEARIDELVALLDLGAVVDRRTVGFSHGERSKVALARALVHDPANIVLDEPTVGLDVMSTRAMRAFIRDLRDTGHCVVFSSHIMQEVSALCDEVVIVAGGTVASRGTPDALREATGQATLEDAFVAAIGSAEGLE
jgi:sodium transport system ATP-binding protein